MVDREGRGGGTEPAEAGGGGIKASRDEVFWEGGSGDRTDAWQQQQEQCCGRGGKQCHIHKCT